MMSLERSEKSGNPTSYPDLVNFAKLLDWHLKFGTRPDGGPVAPGKRWNSKEFAAAVGSNERTVRNWCKGRNPPKELGTIERILFGKNPDYNTWRSDLRAAYDNRQQILQTGHGIPPPPAYFLGRKKDLDSILGVLLASQDALAILIQGSPGIGKSSLTRAIGCHVEIIRRFGEDNRWFVELETATTADAMQDAITRSLGGDPSHGFDITLELLQKRPGLLILDNLETPWDPKTERIATENILAALSAIPGLALLASFRGLDRIGGPAWTLVHPVVHLDPPYDTELFCSIAQKTFEDDPNLPDLISALGGVPLAIELVAARAHSRNSLTSIWAQWTRIGAELAAHPDFDAGRLTSLPHSIELSLQSSRLTPVAHRLFRLLGQLPSGLSVEDLDHLLGSDGFDAEDALLRIGLAVEREDRLDLLPPIRDHAARHHPATPPDDTAWPAHYLAMARELGETIGTKNGEGAVSRLLPEFANMEAAIRYMLVSGRRLDTMTALTGFGRLAYIASQPAPVLVGLAAACRAESDVLGEANCIQRLGNIALARSDHDTARKAYEDALPLFRQVGSVLGEANCIQRLGDIALARSDHDTARKAYEDALPLYRGVGDLLGEANCIKRLGDIALARSDHDTARKAYEDALPLFRQVGDLLGEANCIQRLGDIALARSDHDTARKAYEDALPLYRQVGSVLGEANCIQRLGDIALARSDHDAARKAYEDALPLYRQVGSVLGEANCIQRLGDIALARSDHDAAHKAYEDALPLYRQVGSVLGEANCIKRLGDIALARSDHDAARKAYEDALPLYRGIGSVLGEANCIKTLGDIALARSGHNAARKAYEDALLLYRQVGDVLGEANCTEQLKECR